MSRQIIINSEYRERRAALVNNNSLEDLFFERDTYHKIAGNIYRGRVQDVLPGMQAAFVDIGISKNAFIHLNDLYPLLDNNQKSMLKEKKLNVKHVLQPGQWLLVQVVKEPMGSKGAKVTCKISIPGRYFVYIPSDSKIGVSRRITDNDERDRLRDIAVKLKSDKEGLIIRTNAYKKDFNNLKNDYNFLSGTWKRIRNQFFKSSSIERLYQEEDLLKNLIRDYLDHNVDRVVVDDKKDYQRLMDLTSTFAPELKSRIAFYQRNIPILAAYNIEKEIESLLKRRVWLKSGGYIVIDNTEALVSIDVNTGKFVGKKNLQDTILKTNKEAAEEIARQLKLRDIGGIIIIDFIDMKKYEDQQEVINLLEEELQKDRTKTSILGLTQLGLLEMTRKKVREGFGTLMQKDCPCCGGTGQVLSESTVAMKVIRKIDEITSRENYQAIALELHPEVAAVLIGSGGDKLKELEDEFGINIYISGNAELRYEDIVMEKGSREEMKPESLDINPGDRMRVVIEEEHASNSSSGIARIDGFIIIVNGAGNMVGTDVEIEIDDLHRTYARAHLT
ncbi:MAG: Rne/Rng family ribonuclease [Bacillota bacterium]